MPQKNVMSVWEITSLHLEYLWEAIPCHQTASQQDWELQHRHATLGHAPRPKSPGTKQAAQTGTGRWRLGEASGGRRTVSWLEETLK